MAGFVDCTKYNKEQQEQDTRIDNLEKREIVHDETLKGGGIDEKSPLGLNASTEKDNAIKADKNGVYVKDLEPQVEKLEEALKNKYDRLGNDLEARIRELNGKLNALKDIEVALAAAKAEGNYNKIKELEARLQAAKEAQQTGDKGLAEAIEALRKEGLSDDDINKIIADAIAKAGGTGRYITRIVPTQNDGTVTYYYSDGTSTTGKLANFGGVVADQRTIVGNGHDQALKVNLSKQSGNQLRVLDDGLYYGTSYTKYLYVDAVGGSDENVGSQAKPLKTIRQAFHIIDEEAVNKAVIYLHEDMEHTIDAAGGSIGFDSLSVDFKPYGSRLEAEIKSSTDDTAAAYKMLQAGYEPKLVFKGYNTWKNSDSSNGGYRFVCLAANRSTINFWGVTLINDIGMDLGWVVPNSTNVKEAGRVQTRYNSTITCNMVKLKSRGETTGASDELIYADKAKNLYSCGFFYPLETGVTLYTLRNDLATDCKCPIIPRHGWNFVIDTATVLNIDSNTEANKRFIGKAVMDPVFDDLGTIKILKVPATDTQTKYFL